MAAVAVINEESSMGAMPMNAHESAAHTTKKAALGSSCVASAATSRAQCKCHEPYQHTCKHWAGLQGR